MEINSIRLYKIHEVAKALHLGTRDVSRLIKSRQLRATRVRENSRPRVTGKSILAYIDRQSTVVK